MGDEDPVMRATNESDIADEWMLSAQSQFDEAYAVLVRQAQGLLGADGDGAGSKQSSAGGAALALVDRMLEQTDREAARDAGHSSSPSGPGHIDPDGESTLRMINELVRDGHHTEALAMFLRTQGIHHTVADGTGMTPRKPGASGTAGLVTNGSPGDEMAPPGSVSRRSHDSEGEARVGKLREKLRLICVQGLAKALKDGTAAAARADRDAREEGGGLGLATGEQELFMAGVWQLSRSPADAWQSLGGVFRVEVASAFRLEGEESLALASPRQPPGGDKGKGKGPGGSGAQSRSTRRVVPLDPQPPSPKTPVAPPVAQDPAYLRSATVAAMQAARTHLALLHSLPELPPPSALREAYGVPVRLAVGKVLAHLLSNRDTPPAAFATVWENAQEYARAMEAAAHEVRIRRAGAEVAGCSGRLGEVGEDAEGAFHDARAALASHAAEWVRGQVSRMIPPLPRGGPSTSAPGGKGEADNLQEAPVVDGEECWPALPEDAPLSSSKGMDDARRRPKLVEARSLAAVTLLCGQRAVLRRLHPTHGRPLAAVLLAELSRVARRCRDILDMVPSVYTHREGLLAVSTAVVARHHTSSLLAALEHVDGGGAGAGGLLSRAAELLVELDRVAGDGADEVRGVLLKQTSTVLAELARQPWGSHREPAVSGSGSLVSSAVRLWRLQLWGCLCDLCEVCAPQAAERIFAGLLEGSAMSLAAAYLSTRPSAAQRARYSADIMMFVSTLLACRGKMVSVHPVQIPGGQGQGGAGAGGRSARGGKKNAHTPQEGPGGTRVLWIDEAEGLGEVARVLAVRAALLTCPSADLPEAYLDAAAARAMPGGIPDAGDVLSEVVNKMSGKPDDCWSWLQDTEQRSLEAPAPTPGAKFRPIERARDSVTARGDAAAGHVWNAVVERLAAQAPVQEAAIGVLLRAELDDSDVTPLEGEKLEAREKFREVCRGRGIIGGEQ